MELRHLEAFLAVVEEGSFTGAAQRLRVAQSGVSATVGRLERELGVRLLERTSRRVHLTEAGEAFLPRARETLDAARSALDSIAAVSPAGLGGTLRLGSVSSLRLLDLPGLLGRFRKEHPRVDLRLQISTSGSIGLAEALLSGRLDLAVASLPPPAPAGLRISDLLRLPIDLVVSADHRVAGRGTVALAELADERFIEMPAGFGSRAVTDAAFAARNLNRRIALEVTELERIVDFVRHGLGVALTPRYPNRDVTGLSIVRIDDEALWWPLAAIESAHRRRSAAVLSILTLLHDEAQRIDRAIAEL